MKRKLLSICLLIVLICTTGCSSKIQGQNLMKNVHAENIKVTGDFDNQNTEIMDFAIRLFQAGEEGNRNTLISPMSVLCALAMTANGAKEDTLAQMEAVLGMPTEKLNEYLYSYLKKLPQGKDYRLYFANSIWFTDDEDFTVNQDFLQLNANYYGADIYKAPFDHSTLDDINHWVKAETDNMIPKILDTIPKEAVMYLINALAFEAEWESIYKENQVRDGIFTLENGKTQPADFMYSEERNYLEDENATGFMKYYKDGKYAFVALLPKENMSVSDYITRLNGESFHKLITNRENTTVHTAIPKFTSESSLEMSEVLSNMGMTDAFDEKKANFTGLGTFQKANLFINRVLHKTYISVGEKGTKAGAVTAVEVAKNTGAALEEPKKVYLDRPFVYMLIDCETNIPFFIGTMRSIDNSVVKNSTKVEYEASDFKMSLQIPDGWEHAMMEPVVGDAYEERGICFWPKGLANAKIKLAYYDFWGVCGTGLKEKKITIGKYTAIQGTYDNHNAWYFIYFPDVPDSYVVINEMDDNLWMKYGAEVMDILSTVKLAGD